MSSDDASPRTLRDLLSALRRGLIDADKARSSARGRLERGGPLEAGGLADLLGLNDAGQGEDELQQQLQSECQFLEGVPFQPGSCIGGKYEVRKILRGGFGLVYLCRSLAPELYHRGDSLAALKCPLPQHLTDPELCELFVAEAVNSVALTPHPNLVLAYGVEMHNRIPFLVMEHITGGRTLVEEIENGRTDWRTTLRHGLDMARGLAHAAQEAQLIHGDLKPPNVLITGDGVAKVSDFGLSLSADAAGADGLIAGTDGFMAPEMVARRTGRSTVADVYAYGVTLLCAVLGRFPEAARPGDLCTAAHMPEPLAALLRECLAIDPAARPANFQIIAARLEGMSGFLLGARPSQPAAPDAPLRADALVNAAQTWLNLGQPRKAQAEVEHALRLNSANWKAHQIQNCIHLERRDFDAAYRSAKQARQLALDEPGPAANLAQAAMSLGRRDDALTWLDLALELAYESGRMGELDGSSLLFVELLPAEQALQVLDAIVTAQPGAAITWNNRAILLRRMKQPAEALASADHAIALNAAYAKAWTNRANALIELHRFAEAQTSASTALDLDPCLPGAYCAKATSLAQQGRLPEARAAIRSGLSLLPADPLLLRAAQVFAE
ncbi:protein kinase domain-containing protein [Prosthecobacter sp.]|uniref:protein kinase domain-containing protein n=1 Tax=Prosthecobacter sp. TaxID=1965333 RepID=UPI003783CDD6